MPTYTVTAPDGHEYDIDAPEGASEGEVLAFAQANYQKAAQPPIVDLPAVKAQKPDFSDVSADVDTTESTSFDWRGLPYVVKPSQMNDGSAGEFFAGHARDAGRSVRSALRGVGGVLDILGEPIAQGIDYVTQPKTTLGDLVSGEEPQRTLPRQVRFRELGDMAADAIGVGRPETAGQRVVDDIGQALSGTAATMGAGGVLTAGRSAAANPTLGERVGEVLLAQPGLQAVSAASGSGAAGLTREAGGGEGLQIGASLLGTLAPGTAATVIPRVPTGIVPDIAKQATRRAFRGGASAKDVETALGEFQAAGTTPSVGQATGNRFAQGAETFLSNVPGGAGRMAQFGQRQAEEVGARVGDLAAGLTPRGASASQAEVGTAIRAGLVGPDPEALIPRMREVANKLYAKVDESIPADTRVDVGATRAALADLNSIIEGAPSVSRFFQNAKLQGIEAGLANDVGGIDAVLTRPGMRENADAYRQFLKENAAAASERNLKRKQLGVPGEEPVMGDADIDADVAATLGNMVDDKLPYEALRKLRTLVGNEIEDFSLGSDVPRSKWKALYGSLTDDMRAAVAGNPQAEAAWERANKFHKRRVERIEAIEHVVDKSGGPEAVYKAAFGNTKDGATTLRTVMRSLPSDARREMSASFVRRMGRAVGSQQDADGGVFSMESFLTNWANLAPEAKRELFDFFGNDYRSSMDKIAKMAEKARASGQVFKNASGTTRQGALIGQTVGTAATAGSALATGNAGMATMVLLGSLGSAAVSNLSAKLMTNPRFVKWLSGAAEKPTGELLGQLQALNRIGKNMDDPELSEAASELQKAMSEEQQQAQ